MSRPFLPLPLLLALGKTVGTGPLRERAAPRDFQQLFLVHQIAASYIRHGEEYWAGKGEKGGCARGIGFNEPKT